MQIFSSVMLAGIIEKVRRRFKKHCTTVSGQLDSNNVLHIITRHNLILSYPFRQNID